MSIQFLPFLSLNSSLMLAAFHVKFILLTYMWISNKWNGKKTKETKISHATTI
jgi:hypothetical protein